MKKNSLLILMLVILLLPGLVACSPSGETPSDPAAPLSSNNYEIFIVSSANSSRPYFSNAVTSYRKLYPEAAKPAPMEMLRTIQVDGVSYEVNYSKTFENYPGTYTHQYVTADNKVSCLYWAANMQLARILIDMDLAQFANMDQQQYEQWIQSFVGQYVQEDWSKYRMTCRTTYKKPVEGFLTEPQDGEPVKGYEFDYVRYIHSVPTTDDISVRFKFDPEAGTAEVLIWFSRHEFDNLDGLVLDEEAIHGAIDAYLRQYAGENITLVSWEMLEGSELSVINGNVMLSCRLSTKYKWNTLSNNDTVELMIDIPDP